MIIWVQITSGRGPAECRHAVWKLSDIFMEEARGEALKPAILKTAAGEGQTGLLSCLISIEGEEAACFAESWNGTILWRCQSPFRPKHKRKNWYVGVDILKPPENCFSNPDVKDIRFQKMRSSGPGGQHANKTESAIRAIHLPTGLSATAQEERSQYLNKKLAISRVMHLLEKRRDEAGTAQDRQLWDRHQELERGNPVRKYKGMDFIRS